MEGSFLSLPQMFMSSSTVGKLVVLVLAFASIATWVLIIDGVFVLWRLSASLDAAQAGDATGVIAPIPEAARKAAAIDLRNEDVSAKRERIADDMSRAARDILTSAESGLSALAVIASAGPLLGLFGTVWGLMTSFVAVASTQDANLAVVAPGMAEALSTTAYGLIAAIPAAVGYNRIAAGFARLAGRFSNYIAEESLKHVLEDGVRPAAAGPSSSGARAGRVLEARG